jgi:hypothetical protein
MEGRVSRHLEKESFSLVHGRHKGELPPALSDSREVHGLIYLIYPGDR